MRAAGFRQDFGPRAQWDLSVAVVRSLASAPWHWERGREREREAEQHNMIFLQHHKPVNSLAVHVSRNVGEDQHTITMHNTMHFIQLFRFKYHGKASTPSRQTRARERERERDCTLPAERKKEREKYRNISRHARYSNDFLTPSRSPITYGGPNRPGGLTRPLCPGEEKKRERERERECVCVRGGQKQSKRRGSKIRTPSPKS